MKFVPELLALLVILIFAALLLLAIQASKRQAAEKTHLALTMGFERQNELPPQLASRVEDLFKRRDQQAVYIDDIFSRQEYDQELFIFDVSDSNEEDNEMGTEVFGMISNQLALPRFSLTTLPGFSSDTLLGNIMDTLLDKFISLAGKYQQMDRIEFPDDPKFDDQVIVFGSNETAVRDLLRGINLNSLITGRSPIHIAGNGDFLTIDFSLPSSYGSDENDLIAQYQQFTQISRYFMH
jgi:hypothetical protein